MARIKITYDDSELRELLKNAQEKKVYRQLANDVLYSLRDDIASYTHVDTGEMKASWEVTPLKMRDSGYAVFGEVTNDAQKHWHKEPYPSYEIARGGSHNAVDLGINAQEQKLNSSISDVLEGLLK